MRIRNEQMAAFRQVRFDDFSKRLAGHLRKYHPDQLASFSDEEIHTYIRECVERASRLYSIQTEQAVACYAQLPFILGDQFEVAPDLAAIPAMLGRQSFEQNTRAKMALALAYQLKQASAKK